jgi:hypothetical protein
MRSASRSYNINRQAIFPQHETNIEACISGTRRASARSIADVLPVLIVGSGMAKAKVANWRRSKRHAKEKVLVKGGQIQPAKSAILYLDLGIVRR